MNCTSNLYLAFGFGGPMEMAIIALVVLLLFGNKLPSVARNLGRSFTEFKRGIRSSNEDPAEPLENKSDSHERIEQKG